MSDLFKSALSYIGSASSNPPANNSSSVSSSSSSHEIIRLGGDNVKILRPIAEGGSSYVYGGQFVKSGLVIAVKKIPCQHDNEDKILSEIKYMNGFNHINIAKYHGYNKLSGVYWIGMEYCSSLRLPLRSECVGPVFGQIVSGVDYLHQLGITHWDLKVENCMLGRDNMIKLIDFGSSSSKVYNTSNLTSMQRNQLEDELFQFTTPMYRPPELLDLWSEMDIDSRVDLWALGCLLYYLVHTEHPFADSNKLAIINCKYTKKPSIFQHIIDGLLVINPNGRWSLAGVINEFNSMGIDFAQPIKGIPFEELQITTTIPNMIANTQSTSILHSIRGGAENLFKNIKESSSRMYSSQPQQPGQQQPPPSHQKEHPQRPPPPKPQQPNPESIGQSIRRQLSGEEESRGIKESSIPPPNDTAYDLLSGFGSDASTENVKKETVDVTSLHSSQSRSQKKFIPEPSIDLLGGFKDDESINLMDSSSSGKKSNDLLEDLFSLGTSTPIKSNVAEVKKDPFDSFLLGEETSVPVEKPLILPTSSSFSQLSSLKVDSSKSTNDMIKSTPNLNDLMFGDLLNIDSTTTTAAGKTRGGGQSTSIRFGQPSTTTATSSVPFSNASGIGLSGFGVRNPSNFTPPVPNFNNSQTIGGNVPFGSANLGSGNSVNISSSSNNMMGGIQFSNFSSSTTTNNMNTTAFSSDAIQNKSTPTTTMGGGILGSTSTNEIKTPGSSGPSANKKIDLNAAFGEFLNEQGFTGGSSQTTTNRTINDMRRTELSQTKTPEQLKVNDWVEGKRKNIRALLSTLHTVVWDSCSWKPASMSLMVDANDVKKVYRKACLAIHPDKQRGQEWEELAKLIFVELNDAWNHFENE